MDCESAGTALNLTVLGLAEGVEESPAELGQLEGTNTTPSIQIIRATFLVKIWYRVGGASDHKIRKTTSICMSGKENVLFAANQEKFIASSGNCREERCFD